VLDQPPDQAGIAALRQECQVHRAVLDSLKG